MQFAGNLHVVYTLSNELRRIKIAPTQAVSVNNPANCTGQYINNIAVLVE